MDRSLPAPIPLTRENTAGLIPAFREASHIAGVVTATRQRLERVWVVDDGSGDATADRAKAAGAEVIEHPTNLGKGGALKTGLGRVAVEGVAAVVCLDGDGQHDAGEIEAFMETANREPWPELIIGNRFSDPAGMPPVRYWTNRVMSGWISRLCGQRIPDTQCGFRLLRSSLFEAMDLPTSGYDYESEMIFTVALLGCPIGHVPVRTIYGDEKSKIRPVHDTLRFLKLVSHYRGRCWAATRRRRHGLGAG